MARCAVAMMLAAACLPAAKAQLRVAGTDLLGADFSKALYTVAIREKLAIAVAFDGSRPGFERLKSGRADLALVVLPEAAAKPPVEFESFVAAYHRIVVLAPAACPLEQLSLDVLARVFDGGFTGRTMRWQELGVVGDFGMSNVQPVVPDGVAGFTTEFFRRVVLQGRPCAGLRYVTTDSLANQFTGESRALALAATPLAGSTAKILAIAARTDEPAFLPTPENVHSGDYPLRLPLHVVYRRERAAALRPLLQFLAGDAAAPVWERAGVVPLPASVRARQVSALGKE